MGKTELIKILNEEHSNWESFLDQIGPSRMEQAGVNGDWSMKDMIAHLTGLNHWLVIRMEAAQHDEQEPSPPWPAHLQKEDEINAWIHETQRGRSLHAILDESD